MSNYLKFSKYIYRKKPTNCGSDKKAVSIFE